jgi:hypothetical protein
MTAFVLVGAAIAAIVLLQPLFDPVRSLRPLRERPGGPEARRSWLEGRRESLFQGLRELDFDFAVGKLAETDYRSLREDLLAKLAETMAELERLDRKRSVLDSLEAEIRARREPASDRRDPS